MIDVIDVIDTANKEKLQKIISVLQQKDSQSWDRTLNPTDAAILSAAQKRLKTVTTGGRPKPSKKRSTARRLRSSKARKSRKARATRRK
jgi:hypothetical protein